MAVSWTSRTVVVPTQDVRVASFRASTIVGSQPPSVWGDDSDATYAYSEQEYGTLVGNVAPEITVNLEPQPDLYVHPDMRCAVWIKVETNASVPMEVRLTASPGADYRLTNEGVGHSAELAAPAGWISYEMQPSFWPVYDTMASWQQGSTIYLTLQAAAPDPDPEGSFVRYHRVFEARVVVYSMAPTVAPPCRLFPRDDGLGVGGGRHYPPPKSQQRSGRRFGYY